MDAERLSRTPGELMGCHKATNHDALQGDPSGDLQHSTAGESSKKKLKPPQSLQSSLSVQEADVCEEGKKLNSTRFTRRVRQVLLGLLTSEPGLCCG